MRLDFKPERWGSTRYRVTGSGGESVALVDVSAWRTRILIELPGHTLDLRRDPLDGALVLLRDGLPEAQAVKTSVWTFDFDLEWTGGKGRLQTSDSLGNTYVLEHAGQRLARLKQSAWGTGKADGAFPDDWPVERALFVGGVALLAWRAQSGG